MSNEEILSACLDIDVEIISGNLDHAREILFRTLASVGSILSYPDYLNEKLRYFRLYQYIRDSEGEQSVLLNAYSIDLGEAGVKVLHMDQSAALKRLLNGESIALCAPTSFGKSFLIDAIISLKSPKNVVIIVPTIALMDEMRCRLISLFKGRYKIISSDRVAVGANNIFIFPQERALGLVKEIDSIDLLIVDEFYKADDLIDPERGLTLRDVILRLKSVARQCFYLMPPVEIDSDSLLMNNVKVHPSRLETVYQNIHHFEFSEEQKLEKAGDIVRQGKTLIYAHTHDNLGRIASSINLVDFVQSSEVVKQYLKWVQEFYGANWSLVDALRSNIGLHNGLLHRPLSQLNVHLFEQGDGLSAIVSTSSIIEGVNTVAENVIVWSTKSLTHLAYRNLIGRAGRMFKYFVGNIYLFDKDVPDDKKSIHSSTPDSYLVSSHGDEHQDERRQIISRYENIFPSKDLFLNTVKFIEDGIIQSKDLNWLNEKVTLLKEKPDFLRAFLSLNSQYSGSEQSNIRISKLIKTLSITTLRGKYKAFYVFIKAAFVYDWKRSVRAHVEEHGLALDDFFFFERFCMFTFATKLSDFNTISVDLIGNKEFNLGGFIQNLSTGFMPISVPLLEEYGLPRSLTAKLHVDGAYDFETEEFDVDAFFAEIPALRPRAEELFEGFEIYIWDLFLKKNGLK